MTNSVTIIDHDEIERSSATTLQELLQSKAAIFISQSGQLGSASSIRLRGLPTGFSKIIIDNIELNDPTDINNSYQINNISLENIESIEILKGSQSVLYGQSAIGGVIKINTKKGYSNAQLQASYGSYDTKNLALQNSGHTGKLSYGMSATYLQSDGFSAINEDRLNNAEDDSFKNTNLNLNLSYYLNQQLEISFQSQYIYSEIEIDGFNFTPVVTPIDIVQNDLNKYQQSNNFLGLTYFGLDDKISITPSIRYSSIKKEDPSGVIPLFKGEEVEAKLDATYQLQNSAKIFFGSQYLQQTDIVEHTSSELNSIYSTLNLERNNKFYDIGVRLDKFSTFDFNTIASFGMGIHLNQSWTIKGNISQGYKLPTLYQLANQVEELGPSDSINSEATLSFKGITLSTEFTLFNYELRNQIDYDTVAMGYRNIARSRIQGSELSLKKEFREGLILNSSITYQSAKNLKTKKDLGRTPKYLASLELTYKVNQQQRITNWWQYVGEREDFGKMPSYIVGNLNYEYKQFNLKIINILDKNYENVRYYGTQSRSFYVGYKLAL